MKKQTAFEFSPMEWSILNDIIYRPEKAVALQKLEALQFATDQKKELRQEWNEASAAVERLKKVIGNLSADAMRELFLLLPVDICTGKSLYS